MNDQAKKLGANATFLDIPVTVSPHKSLNSSKGVIRSHDLRRRRCRGTEFSASRCIGMGRYKCQHYGHGKDRCKKPAAVCVRCGKGSHVEHDCSADPHCVNCRGDHAANRWPAKQQIICGNDTVVQWNIPGFRSNFEELKLLLNRSQSAVVALQECRLGEGQVPPLGYTLLLPQGGFPGGEAALLIRNGTRFSEIDLKTGLHAAAATISLEKTPVCSLYLPPNSPLSKLSAAELFGQLPKPFLVLGDFKVHSPAWGDSRRDGRGRMLEEFTAEKDLIFKKLIRTVSGTYANCLWTTLWPTSSNVLQSFSMRPGRPYPFIKGRNLNPCALVYPRIIRYVHLMAHFRMYRQIREQTLAFVRGFKSVVNSEWLSMFSSPELQKLISGDSDSLDIEDLRRHTHYHGGYHNNHKVINWLWDIVANDLNMEEKGLFLKKPCTEAARGAVSVASKRKAEDLPTLTSASPFAGWSPFKKFMVISSKGSAKVADRSPFKIHRELKSILGDETIEVTKLGSGDLMVELKSNDQAKKLGAIATFLDIPVTVSPHKSLNSSKGVIRSRDLRCCSEEEMVEELSSVTHARRIKVRRGEDKIQTDTVV
ncbi:ubiquitin-protein ligase e3b [Plakobranchus ocellatus]|uniref:HECT-type E3 ubiquitin transferase n=1 Tax=Plakobranchus ocellatus TaxID=259542 RepID=A0AAV4B4V5_9GAST|nr:ubiquitin-protein ligase e3b [Plakobranchus ocellatus]